jgi:hypothetical protein
MKGLRAREEEDETHLFPEMAMEGNKSVCRPKFGRSTVKRAEGTSEL